MAQESDKPRRKGTASKVAVWIILLLLVGGLAGVGVGGFGGSTTNVGSVGETEITIQQYENALRQELNFETRLRGEPVSLLQAQQEGIDRRVLGRLAGAAALSEEARVQGLSVGDAEVARALREVPAFQGPDGSFDREAYEFALERNNLSPKRFEEELRSTSAREVLQQAVIGGLTVNDTYARTLYGFLAEQRNIRWARIDASLLVDPNPEPTEAQILSFYTDTPEPFTRPEARQITYAWLTPDMLVETIEVSEDDLRAAYEARDAEYNQPERRMVERLGFADMAAAQAAKSAVEAGETTFEALVEERGLTLEDVDQGEVARTDLDSAIADAVFALTEPGLSAPVETSLGPALYRINAVLQPTSVPFEEARADLRREQAIDNAARAISDQVIEIDDLLAGGATLEELGRDTDMTVGSIAFTQDSNMGIAAYDAFRRVASQVTTSDFPEIATLSDGGIFAVRLDEIIPPTVPPLEEIRSEVIAAWNEAETARRLAEMGENLKTQVEAGADMEALGLAPVAVSDLTRTARVDGAPIGMSRAIFDMELNGVTLFQEGANTALIALTGITAADMESDEAQGFMAQLEQQATQSLASDVFEAYGQTLQQRHGLSLNQATLNAIHAMGN